MKIFIGSDHAGFELKKEIISYLSDLSMDVSDLGAYELNNTDDYPDFIIPTAKAVALHNGSLGIVIGGSGQGEQICANKISGIRSILYYGGDLDLVKLGREHNDANILSLGARFLDIETAKNAIKMFIYTDFSNDERHVRRINKLETLRYNID